MLGDSLESELSWNDHIYSIAKAAAFKLGFLFPLMVTLDISKSFDHIWHKILHVKLPGFDFTSKLCKWLESFL